MCISDSGRGSENRIRQKRCHALSVNSCVTLLQFPRFMMDAYPVQVSKFVCPKKVTFRKPVIKTSWLWIIGIARNVITSVECNSFHSVSLTGENITVLIMLKPHFCIKVWECRHTCSQNSMPFVCIQTEEINSFDPPASNISTYV